MKKRVVIDARMVGGVGHGIGNYVLDIAAALKDRTLPFEVFFLVAHKSHPLLRTFPHQESNVPFLHPLEPWRLPQELEQAHLFHSPSFMSLASYPCAHVQTVHDLNHLKFGNLAQKIYYRFLLLPSLKKAEAIASVSQTAAQEIKKWMLSHGVNKGVEEVPNAIAAPAPAQPDTLERLGLKHYFFCLSNPKAFKNTAMLETAHARAWERGDCLPLVTNVNNEFQEGVFRTSALTGQLEPGDITALFAGAQKFFFPSLYEGFGRPPLEAALAGCASVVSDIPVHREVHRGVAETEFLDPKDARAWEEAFLRWSRAPRTEVSAASKATISRRYSVQELGDRMEKFYRQGLSL